MISYLRIGLAVGAAILIGLIWWRVQLSFSQGAELAEQRAHIDALTSAAARDNRTSQELARFRGQQSDWSHQFHEDLTAKPLTQKVPPHVDPKTGVAEPCVQRIPARYRELFNEAVTGAPGVP